MIFLKDDGGDLSKVTLEGPNGIVTCSSIRIEMSIIFIIEE